MHVLCVSTSVLHVLLSFNNGTAIWAQMYRQFHFRTKHILVLCTNNDFPPFYLADITTILTPDDLQSFQYNIPPYQHNHQTNHRYVLRHSTNCKHVIITSDSRLKPIWLFSVTTLGVKAAVVALFHPPVVLVQSPSSWKSAERAWSTYSGRLTLWNVVVISFKKYPSDRLLYHRYPHDSISPRSKLKNFH